MARETNQIRTNLLKKARNRKLKYKRRIFLGIFALWFVYTSLSVEVSAVPLNIAEGKLKGSTGLLKVTGEQKNILRAGEIDNLLNCTNPAILEFPDDIFTQEQRQSGAVLAHFFVSVYIFYAITLVCDSYFVPSIERLCGALNLPGDVAGATFMAITSSAPELFTNIIGTFITEGDIGVGTVAGSAVFNIFAVCACCGFAASSALHLEWYPLSRDCIFYSGSLLLLASMLGNRQVFWYHGLVLVLVYFLYIIVMWNNTRLKNFAEFVMSRVSQSKVSSTNENTPLLGGKWDSNPALYREQKVNSNYDEDYDSGKEEEDDIDQLIASALKLPEDKSYLAFIEWILFWPLRLLFAVTMPDVRKDELSQYYPLTLTMCLLLIGLLSYVATWFVTVIGYTLEIPDTVMGLTFLAAGASVPEIVSAVILARQGLGSMSISTSIGSNIFDILLALGLPWLIKGSMIAENAEGDNFIQINSAGLEYSVMLLIISLILFYGMLALNGFYLDRKVAILASCFYALFISVACLLELNVFFDVNPPTCNTS